MAMINKLFIGLAIFIALTSIVFGLTYKITQVRETQDLRSKAAPATTLFFSPENLTVSPNGQFNIEAKINTGSNTVSAAEVYINFDKNLLEFLEAELGNFLSVKLVGISADNTSGKITFTLGSQPANPSQGEGVLAKMIFKARTNTGQAQISFDQNTQVAAVGESGNVILSRKTAQVNVQNASLNMQIKFEGINSQRTQKATKIILQKTGDGPKDFQVNLTANSQGIYSGTVDNLSPGLYTVFIKGPAHLNRKLAENINLSPGNNSQDFSSTSLTTGDIVDNNKIDIFDYNIVVSHFGPRLPAGGSPADLDSDNDVDIFDYNFLVGNFGKSGEWNFLKKNWLVF